MRISDWSSDVCSSDLEITRGNLAAVIPPPGHDEIGAMAKTLAVPGQPDRAGPADRRTGAGRGGEAPRPDAPCRGGRGRLGRRSEERREGKECVSTCKSRGSPSH